MPYGDRSVSTLAQVMAWCLMAPSTYLNQCWLITTKAFMKSLWHVQFRVNGQGHRVIWIFCVRSVPIWPIIFLCGIHTTHEVTMCRAPFLGQRSRSHGSFKFPVFLLRISALTWRIHFICGTHTTHKKATCHTIYRSTVKVTRVVWVFGMCSQWLGPYLTNSLHMEFVQPVRRQCVAHYFQVKRSKVKVTSVVQSFCCVQLCGSVPIWLIHFNYMNPGYFTLVAIDLKP